MCTTTVTQNFTHFHWTQEIWNHAWHSNDCSVSSVAAKIACIVFPILLTVAIVDGILWAWSACKISSDPNKTPLDPQSVKQANIAQQTEKEEQLINVDTPVTEPALPAQGKKTIVTIALPEGSNLYEFEMTAVNRYTKQELSPSACVYHAVEATHYVAMGYHFYGVDSFAEFQRLMITSGYFEYFAAVRKDPTLKDAVDLETIRTIDRNYLRDRHLYLDPTNQEPKPVAERIQAIVQHMFIPQDEPGGVYIPKIVQISLLKGSNKQTVSLIYRDEHVIFFNSHRNVITITVGKEGTKDYLTELLQEEIDQQPFSYALGQYNNKK